MMKAAPIACLCAALALPALAQSDPPQTDLTLVIEPYAGSEERVRDRVIEAFGQVERVTGFADGRVETERFEGRVMLQRFRNPPDRSTFEILANYRTALEARGFVVEWECESRATCGNGADGGWLGRNGMNLGINRDVRYLTGQMPYEGGTVFVSVGVERGNHYLQILQTDAMQTDQVRVLDAEVMASALDLDGRITIDNIYFEFGKADLLPESDTALTEIARLMTDRPDIALYVVGHTDSVGGLDANQALSLARARAVVTALQDRFGIAPGRAVPAGVGPLAPVASNATEEGRALNRRVEIVLR